MRIEDKVGYIGFFVCVIIFVIAFISNTINCL
jgi:hypothetical protein